MTVLVPPFAALTIAGSDSSGGAGIQADLKSFAAHNVHGASVITAVTAQNTVAVTDIHTLPLKVIEAQLEAVFTDLPVRAVKIGMIGSEEIAALVARTLSQSDAEFVVVDTPLLTGRGDALGGEGVVSALKEHLFPLATIITPNLHEAAEILNEPLLQWDGASLEEMQEKLEEQAKGLLGFGSKGVLLKGGHLFDKVSLIKDTELNNRHVIDVYCETDTSSIFVSDWVDCPHNHGTGCALSSALAANLIYGKESGCSLEWAVEQARNWLNRCLRASQHMNLGKGPGPLNIVSVHNIDL